LLSSSLAQPNPEEPKEKQQEAVELEIEGIEMKDMENLVEVVDEMLGFEEPGPAPGPDPKPAYRSVNESQSFSTCLRFQR
jgi:hypothetical protein